MAAIRALERTCGAIADLPRERSDPARLGAGPSQLAPPDAARGLTIDS